MTIDEVDLPERAGARHGSKTGREPAEGLFHSEPWRTAVEASFGVRIETFVPRCEPGGRAYFSSLSDLRGERVVATPFSDFCDPLLGQGGWKEFADHLRSFDVPVTVRPFANEHAIGDASFERRQELLWHGVDISEGFEPVWDGLKSKVRTAIRRAPKAGISFRLSSRRADLATFHAMHVGLRKSKYRLLAQPFSFFANLHEAFGDDLVIVMAEEAGDPVAAMIYIAWNSVWYYKFSASVPRSYRPNAAMFVEACRHGAERGLDLVDMGRSDIDQPGLVSFKRQFASIERPLTTLHWQPSGPCDPRGDQAGATLGALTDLLTTPGVPDEVTARGGEALYRFFG